jgi:hypothetical protein
MKRLVPAAKGGGRRAITGPSNSDASLESSNPAEVIDVTTESANPAEEILPEVNFHGSSEILYRSLLGELHEDIHHDQTAMLVAFVHAVASFSERLAPSHWSPSHGTPREIEPAVVGLAELSAMLRLFFPKKPRDHLNALKQLIFQEIQARASEEAVSATSEHDDDSRRSTKQETRRSSKDRSPQESRRSSRNKTSKDRKATDKAVELGKQRTATFKSILGDHSDTNDLGKPPVVDLGQLLGIRLWRGQIVHPENLLEDLLTDPSPLVLELRRQHFIECMMFVDELQKAFAHSILPGTSTSQSGAPMVTAQQAMRALAAADHGLSEDERCLYVLRGFACRLPDPPSVDHDEAQPELDRSEEMLHHLDLGDAQKRAGVFYKTRTLLREHMSTLLKEERPGEQERVAADVFVHRLSVMGVTKSSDMWNPEVSFHQIALEAGLEIVRPATASAPLEQFLGGHGLIHTGVVEPTAAAMHESPMEGVLSDEDMDKELKYIEGVDRYHAHAVDGRDIQELSIGYTKLGLLHWLACPSL